ncbi:MAG: hypothetical protein OEM97_01710 [Acidimicrobiia bacterium]|nr:hypothetical protein [Acidimicrobiia bacterium]
MYVATAAAPEIDRLVWAVNRRAEREAGSALAAVARGVGLDAPGHIDHFADWLTTVGVRREVAVRRLPYNEPAEIDRWFDALDALDLLEQDGDRLRAAAGLMPLANALLEARTEAARYRWSGHDETVQRLTGFAAHIARAAPASFVVAASHREIPEFDDSYLSLHLRLVTLRYLRAHAHVEAWTEVGLNVGEIRALTGLWLGNETGTGLRAIADKGLATETELTPLGAEMRTAIEADTNRRLVAAFDALSSKEADRFLADLVNLPGAP